MVVAWKHCDSSELSLQVLRIPLFREDRDVLRFHELVLHTLREHARLAPAPHFLAALVEHDELVSFSTRETQLDHLRSVVADVELELDLASGVHRKRGAQLRSALCVRR